MKEFFFNIEFNHFLIKAQRSVLSIRILNSEDNPHTLLPFHFSYFKKQPKYLVSFRFNIFSNCIFRLSFLLLHKHRKFPFRRKWVKSLILIQVYPKLIKLKITSFASLYNMKTKHICWCYASSDDNDNSRNVFIYL